MEERKLEVIRFSISQKENKKDKLKLSEIDGVDLFDNVFRNFVPFIDNLPLDDINKRLVQLGKDENSDSFFRIKSNIRSISGIIETGRYGKEESIIDILNKDNAPVFKIHKNHSVQKPFFFLICIPEIKKDGLIILEREGQYGIKSIFTHVFKRYIDQNFEGHNIDYTNFIDHQIVNNYINNGVYNTITLTRNSLPEDVAERYGLEKFETEDFSVELRIRAKGKRTISGKARKRIQEMFESNPRGFFSSEEFEKLGFDENAKVKVNSTYKNSPRTIDLSDTMKFRPYYNIMVNLNDSGHSDFNSIESEAIKLLDDFNLDLY
ncbi:hypothetical protein [Sunxiuqinia indica]|uniref:hypothetical protein n=1 Tax=Sunxiuqinia indica TaxID=2692584 RepID=UPI00135CD107|nr:hypothetical protein [Sunxiuqinia indica]